MSNMSSNRRVELLKQILKHLHTGGDLEEARRRFRRVLESVPASEIPLAEQQLIREGVPVSEILKLCDLHVQVLEEFLSPMEVEDLPKGHPLQLLAEENRWIAMQAEALTLYAYRLLEAEPGVEAREALASVNRILEELKKARIHYRKIQMLLFPYLERRGITAVPRVLWGKHDQALLGMRRLGKLTQKASVEPEKYSRKTAEEALQLSRILSQLTFRENRILLPASHTLLSEGEWAAIHQAARGIGYITGDPEEWKPKAKPILPYQVEESVTPEEAEKLPPQFKPASSTGLQPDRYRVKKPRDIEFETGFLSREEVESILESLPVEITYADREGRVKFFTQSRLHRGFTRTKTILGRKIEYCHPPRLEKPVKNVVEELKTGRRDYREYWTKLAGRTVRILVVPVRNRKGEYLGTLEIVEDLTDPVENPEKVKAKITVL